MPNPMRQTFPYARSRKRTYRKRRYYPRKRTYRKRATWIARPLTTSGQRFGGFPKVAMTTLRYVDNLPTFNAGAATVDAYFFSCNGAFDPNISGAGAQPMGWDQWTAVYNHYVVVKSRIMVIFSPDDTDATYMAVYGITIDDSGSLSDNATTTMMERGQTRFHVQPAANAATGRCPKITMGFNARKHFGRTDIQDNDQDLGAAVTANPSEQAYYCVWAGALSGDDVGVCRSVVIVEYTIIFSEPKDFPVS